MARLMEAKAVLDAAERWKQECLVGGGSIFSDQRLWTSRNFAELVREYVQKEKLGKKFWDSLALQLQDATPDGQRLFAELVWVYYLVPVGAKAETKRNQIQRVWSWSGEEIAQDGWAMGNLLEQGIIRLGAAAGDIAQDFSFFVEIMVDWCSLSSSEQHELLNEPWDFAERLDRCAGTSKPPFRHVLLYLLFPDSFEPIVSRQDKAKIIAGFTQRWNEQSELDHQSDPILLDRALLKIRRRLQEEHEGDTTSFYLQPLLKYWRPTEDASVEGVLTKAVSGFGKGQSLNRILYGPPGTGKTYATSQLCVEICDGTSERSPEEIRERYGELVQQRRVEFVTFHQSYGYEEFVEGLRPETEESEEKGTSGSGFRLQPVDGVLKRMAERARKVSAQPIASFDLEQRNVFKMGLGNPVDPSEHGIFEECIENNYILLGWGGDVDWSDERFGGYDQIIERWSQNNPTASGYDGHVKFIGCFRNRLKIGDLVIVPAPQQRFRAVGEVTGPYHYVKREDETYYHRRAVRWLWIDKAGMPISDFYDAQITPQTIYQLGDEYLRSEHLQRYLSHPMPTSERLPHVLVIDEINRANVSKVMGELVTLLEEDKREGAPNEVTVTLPHSKERFTLPANLYILGTMNTADRSIALLDTALRRRFEFEEMAPKPELLGIVDEIDLPAVLRAMNERLEWLLGRDRLIGHAWLMGAGDKAVVDQIMRQKIIPMLGEYFHDDWNKVRAVLGGGDEFVQREELRPPGDMEGDTWDTRYRWTPVEPPYDIAGYRRLIDGSDPDGTAVTG